MHVHKVREVVNKHSKQLTDEVHRRMELFECDELEVVLRDSFLAGKVTALADLCLELTILELEEQHARDLNRLKRPES